jgi:hypothetical protein
MALNSSSGKAIAAAIRRDLSVVCSSNNERPLRAEKNSQGNRDNTINNRYLSAKNPLPTLIEETNTMTLAATMSKKEVAIQAYHRSLAALHKSVRVLDEVESNHYQGFKLRFPFKLMLSEKKVSNKPQPLNSQYHLARQAGFIFEGRDLTEFPFSQPIVTPSNSSDFTLRTQSNITVPASASNATASPTQVNRSTFQVRPPLSPRLTDNEIEIFRTLWKRQFPRAFCQPADAVNDWLFRQDEKIIHFWKGRIRVEIAEKGESKSEAGAAEVAEKRQKRRYTKRVEQTDEGRPSKRMKN